MSSSSRSKIRLGVFKFASCDGCELSLLNAEDELLALADRVELAWFSEATSTSKRGPYDIGLVEGSITTHQDAERIQSIRRQCRALITIGACATSGGIQALRNWHEIGGLTALVYAKPSLIRTLNTSTPIAEHVPVDFELRGCPINKQQLLEVISARLAGRKPNIPTYPVCMECKRRGNVCVLVSAGRICLGAVTQAGCGAVCPAFGRGCLGCFGPAESPNPSALTERLRALGHSGEEIGRAYHSLSPWSWVFRQAGEESERHGSR